MDFISEAPIHAAVAVCSYVFLLYLLWSMANKFHRQCEITDELNEIKLQYKHMLDEFATMIDEEKIYLSDSKPEQEENDR